MSVRALADILDVRRARAGTHALEVIVQPPMPKTKKPERPVVEIPEQSWQPSKAELAEPIQVPAGTFEEAVRALALPANVRRVPTGKSHERK